VAKVVWTDKAVADVVQIVGLIADETPVAASRLAQNLMKAGDSLDLFPSRGRAISGGRRQLVHVRPYLIRYRVRGGLVEILQVRHSAMKPD
jgi:toxin ParE1/3/4